MFVLGFVLLVFVLVPLLIFPKTRAFLAAHKKAAAVVVSLYLAALVFHPYLFGMRGYIGEHQFERHLRPGITRDQALQLATQYNALPLDRSPFNARNDGTLFITFIDNSTFCIVNGRTYELLFSPDSRLTEWRVIPYGNAC
jgi:hypothetical protein